VAQQRLCLSSGGRLGSALVGQDAPVDDVGQAPLERAAGLGWGLALAELAPVVAAAGSRVAGLADRDGGQGGVAVAVAAGIQPVALLVAAGGIQGAVAVSLAKWSWLGKRPTSPTWPRSLAATTTPRPWIWVRVLAVAARASWSWAVLSASGRRRVAGR